MRPDVPSYVVLNDVSTFQCCVRVQVVKSESESSPLSPSPKSSPQSPSPSHHLRVRVRESESKKNLSPSHESSSPHIQHLFIFQNMKTNNKMYRMSE